MPLSAEQKRLCAVLCSPEITTSHKQVATQDSERVSKSKSCIYQTKQHPHACCSVLLLVIMHIDCAKGWFDVAHSDV